jgi:hypothetical protein
MYNKHHEMEAIVEDLIDNAILENFSNNFSSKKDCEVALEILISKLEELDSDKFNEMFDN